MFFFASLYTFFAKFKQGENHFKSRVTVGDHIVYQNHISGAFAVAGFLHRLFVDFPNIFSLTVKKIRGVAVLLS